MRTYHLQPSWEGLENIKRAFLIARQTKHRFVFSFSHHYPRITNLTAFVALPFRRLHLVLADLFAKLAVVCFKCQKFFLLCERQFSEARKFEIEDH